MIGTINQLIPKMLNYDKEKLYELKEYKERRSKDANAYFHVLVNKLARHYNMSDEEMKIQMNLDYGSIARDDEGKPIGAKYPKGTKAKEYYEYSKWYSEEENLDLYIFYKRTHLLNKKEMAGLIDGVVQECKDAGIETMTPEQISLLKEEWKQC